MKKPLRTFFFLPLAVFFALIPSRATAQSGSFEIAQHGQHVGTASFSFTSTPDGYDSTSQVSVAMQGLDYALSKTERLSAANQIQHVLLSAVVNTAAVHVTGASDPAQFLLNISANGHSSTTRLDAHSGAVFLPDFDPGALETLLALAVARNNHDLWAIIPKQAGSVEPIQLATYRDEQGSLDGKPIEVHHLVATIAGSSTDLFSGPESQLLQAELPQQGFALVRKGFVLTPPAKAGAPPAEPDQNAAPPAQPVQNAVPPAQPGQNAAPPALPDQGSAPPAQPQ
jgi:hypothetical protein